MLFSTFLYSHHYCYSLGSTSVLHKFFIKLSQELPSWKLKFDFRLLCPAFCSSCLFSHMFILLLRLHFKFPKNTEVEFEARGEYPLTTVLNYWLLIRKNVLKGRDQFCHLLWLDLPESIDAVDHW